MHRCTSKLKCVERAVKILKALQLNGSIENAEQICTSIDLCVFFFSFCIFDSRFIEPNDWIQYLKIRVKSIRQRTNLQHSHWKCYVSGSIHKHPNYIIISIPCHSIPFQFDPSHCWNGSQLICKRNDKSSCSIWM